MARLKATDYATLASYLEGYHCRRIGHETSARREAHAIVVSLFGNDIVALFPDGRVGFTLAGWPTVTTRERVNQFLPDRWAVNQDNHQQYLSDRLNGWNRTQIADYSNWWVVSQDSGTIADANTRYAMEVRP